MADSSIEAQCAQSNVVQNMRAFIERADELDTFYRHTKSIVGAILYYNMIAEAAVDPRRNDILEHLLEVLEHLSENVSDIVMTLDDANNGLDEILDMVGGVG